jgi:predicted ester cyclase
MSLEETQAAIDVYLAVLVGREDIAPFFSDDIVLDLVDVGQQIQGRDAVAGAIVELHDQTFDARPEVTTLLVGEGTAALEAVFVGTHTGEFAGIPATGREVAVPYAVYYDLAAGEITALRIHGFASGLVAALTAEAAPTTGTPTP